MSYRKILVAVDFSECSLRALRLAVDEARHTGGALTLLHIGVAPVPYSPDLATGLGPIYTQLAEQMARESMHQLEKVSADEVPESIERKLTLREGYPPDEILAQVKEGGHDLLVLGTHGRTGLERVLLGSVAERVIRECPVPVLITR